MEHKIKTILYNGNNNYPSTINWMEDCDVPGYTVFTTIKFTMKGNIRTKFIVIPPIWMPKKDAKVLTFKTTSYVELQKWLRKHKIAIKQ